MFEMQSMEARQMLAATPARGGTPREVPSAVIGSTPSATLHSNGTLELLGSSGKDGIEVSKGGSNKRLYLSARLPSKKMNVELPSFRLKDVKNIVVRTGNRDDKVTLGDLGGIRALVEGGNGNDRLSATTGRATLLGGAGDDHLNSSAAVTTPPSPFQIGFQPGAGGEAGDAEIFYRVIANNDGTATIVSDSGVATTVVAANELLPSRNFVAPSVTTTERVAGWTQFQVARGDDGSFQLINIADPSTGAYRFANLTLASRIIAASENRLDGGAGNDTLESLGGDDTVIGGGGEDAFRALASNIDIRFDDLAEPSGSKNDLSRASRVALFDVESVKSGGGIYSSVLVSVNRSSSGAFARRSDFELVG